MPPRHHYNVYGIRIDSDTPLALPRYDHAALGHVECRRAPASAFPKAIRDTSDGDSWYRCVALGDGSTYVRWNTVGEFLVAPDGGCVTCRRAQRCANESFQVYLLGQALSFALVKQRFEPLHATAIVVNGEAFALLGASASGKSTLAASFLNAGYRLLTDDLLVLQESGGRVLAYPGPPRIKLFPRVARRLLQTNHGVEMNTGTGKLILPLDERRSSDAPVPLRAMYCLGAPRDACRQQVVALRTLSARDAFVELIRGAFNRRLLGPQRLKRQFGLMARLTDLVPVRALAYPRALERLGDVRASIVDDLQHVPIGQPTTNAGRLWG
jgi:hypothetical protein